MKPACYLEKAWGDAAFLAKWPRDKSSDLFGIIDMSRDETNVGQLEVARTSRNNDHILRQGSRFSWEQPIVLLVTRRLGFLRDEIDLVSSPQIFQNLAKISRDFVVILKRHKNSYSQLNFNWEATLRSQNMIQ